MPLTRKLLLPLLLLPLLLLLPQLPVQSRAQLLGPRAACS